MASIVLRLSSHDEDAKQTAAAPHRAFTRSSAAAGGPRPNSRRSQFTAVPIAAVLPARVSRSSAARGEAIGDAAPADRDAAVEGALQVYESVCRSRSSRCSSAAAFGAALAFGRCSPQSCAQLSPPARGRESCVRRPASIAVTPPPLCVQAGSLQIQAQPRSQATNDSRPQQARPRIALQLQTVTSLKNHKRREFILSFRRGHQKPILLPIPPQLLQFLSQRCRYFIRQM